MFLDYLTAARSSEQVYGSREHDTKPELLQHEIHWLLIRKRTLGECCEWARIWVFVEKIMYCTNQVIREGLQLISISN